MPIMTVFIPQGNALTITTDAITSGIYVRIASGAEYTPTPMVANTAYVVGPFNEPRDYAIEYEGTEPTLLNVSSGVFTGVDEAAVAPAWNKVNGTEVANAVTASGNAGIITTSELTTAASGSYEITWTNTLITADSVVILSLAGGTNTVKDITVECVPGSGTATLTIYNNVLVTTALDGTIEIAYLVI